LILVPAKFKSFENRPWPGFLDDMSLGLWRGRRWVGFRADVANF
jgi:hypothetical protein